MKSKYGASILVVTLFLGAYCRDAAAQPMPITIQRTSASSVYESYDTAKAVDSVVSDKSRWIGQTDTTGKICLELQFTSKQKVSGVHLYSGFGAADPIEDFQFQFKDAKGEWQGIPSASVVGNRATALRLPFDTTVEVHTQTMRLIVTSSKGGLARIKEVVIWPEGGDVPPLGAGLKAGQTLGKLDVGNEGSTSIPRICP